MTGRAFESGASNSMKWITTFGMTNFGRIPIFRDITVDPIIDEREEFGGVMLKTRRETLLERAKLDDRRP